MPGYCALTILHDDPHMPDQTLMVSPLCCKQANVIEGIQSNRNEMGYVLLSTGGQQALYQMPRVAVLFFDNLDSPSKTYGIFESDTPAAILWTRHSYPLAAKLRISSISTPVMVSG